GNRVDVLADAEAVADALADELRRKLGKVDREITIRLAMVHHDDPGQDTRGVHPDEHLDGPVVGPLERLELGGPECKAEELRLAVGVRRPEGLEVRRIAVLWREARRVREQALELSAQHGIVRRLTEDRRRR